MAGIKELKTRIKSIGSTRKITRAMQMVSAAKMRKAQNATLQSRTYASLAWEMISSVIPSDPPAGGEPRNSLSDDSLRDPSTSVGMTREEEVGMTPLLQTYPNAKKTGVVLLTSNRGLVGSLNSNLLSKIKEINNNYNDNNNETIAEIITYGKKGQVIAARLKKNVVADFPKFDRTITVEDIYPIAKFITETYQTGQYKKIVIVYNHFVSTLSQKPMVKQLLPFSPASEQWSVNSGQKKENTPKLPTTHYPLPTLFEPSPQTVIEHLIPRIIESQIYQTILESDASEHSARMVMMKNATEAAGDLISDLTLTFNQVRQNKITTELAEITAGKIALE